MYTAVVQVHCIYSMFHWPKIWNDRAKAFAWSLQLVQGGPQSPIPIVEQRKRWDGLRKPTVSSRW
eukprot:SAG11_NODE_37_length_21777_cov_4.523711_11_plen_65_part_00